MLSASTRAIGRSLNLLQYFRLLSLCHSLIVWPDTPWVVRHSDMRDEQIETTVFSSEQLRLDPPGIAISVEALYQE